MKRRLTLAFLIVVFLLVAAPYALNSWHYQKLRRPEYAFPYYANQPWPVSAQVIEFSDDHGGFHGEGIFWIVFRLERAELESLLSRPVWGGLEWKDPPITENLLSLVKDRLPRTAASCPSSAPGEMKYVAQQLVKAAGWADGRVMLVDPDSCTVWFSQWNW